MREVYGLLKMAKALAGLVAGVAFALLLSGCGGPDTQGKTLAEARQTLEDAGVPEENITLSGADETDDPGSLTVCDQEPDAAEPDDTVVLQVATSCPNQADDDDDGKKKKRSSGKKRR